MNTHVHLQYYLAQFLLEWKTFPTKVAKKIILYL